MALQKIWVNGFASKRKMARKTRSPLGQAQWTLPGGEWQGKEEERESGNEKGCSGINEGEGE